MHTLKFSKCPAMIRGCNHFYHHLKVQEGTNELKNGIEILEGQAVVMYHNIQNIVLVNKLRNTWPT